MERKVSQTDGVLKLYGQLDSVPDCGTPVNLALKLRTPNASSVNPKQTPKFASFIECGDSAVTRLPASDCEDPARRVGWSKNSALCKFRAEPIPS